MSYLVSLSMLLLLSATPDRGALRVSSQPGVEVVWEGVSLGTTDSSGNLVIREIPVGEYSITLRKEGYREARTRASVTAGETTLRRLLERLPRTRVRGPAPARQPPPPPPPASTVIEETPAQPPESTKERARSATSDDPTASPPVSATPISASEATPSELQSEVAPDELESGDISTDNASSSIVAGRSPDPSAESDEGASSSGLYFLLAALMGVATVYLLRQQRRKPRRRDAQVRADLLETSPTSPSANNQATFLDDLKEREESIASATRHENGREVIEVDVTDVEVLEDEP